MRFEDYMCRHSDIYLNNYKRKRLSSCPEQRQQKCSKPIPRLHPRLQGKAVPQRDRWIVHHKHWHFESWPEEEDCSEGRKVATLESKKAKADAKVAEEAKEDKPRLWLNHEGGMVLMRSWKAEINKNQKKKCQVMDKLNFRSSHSILRVIIVCDGNKQN